MTNYDWVARFFLLAVVSGLTAIGFFAVGWTFPGAVMGCLAGASGALALLVAAGDKQP